MLVAALKRESPWVAGGSLGASECAHQSGKKKKRNFVYHAHYEQEVLCTVYCSCLNTEARVALVLGKFLQSSRH